MFLEFTDLFNKKKHNVFKIYKIYLIKKNMKV